MTPDNAEECPIDQLTQVLETAQADDSQGLAATDRLLQTYPRDARLHFLRGSLLAGLKRYDEARQAMGAAVEIAPAYAIARFQLGLLELTSGDAVASEATWAPLQTLPEDNSLRLFSSGLGYLIRDDWAPAIALLKEGIARNSENPALSRDMQMMIDEAQKKLDEQGQAAEPTSAAQLLLQQYGKETKH